MREPKMNVRLVASPWMDARAGVERGRIRIPKRSRVAFDVAGSRVSVKTTSFEKGMQIRQARMEDVQALAEQVAKGQITSAQADMTVFVCTATRDEFLGKVRRKNKESGLYLSDRIDALKIGADPEFCLVDPQTKRFKYASHVPGLTISGALGQDGPLAELRPSPATTPKKLVATIKKLFAQNRDKIDNYDWIGGATYKNAAYPQDRTLSIGGHIHIGNPSILPEEQKNAIYQRIIQVLDDTVAIPLCRVDTPEPGARRNAKNGYEAYGRWGDTRPQVGRFEWRVPSGFWITHPEAAVAVLGVTKAVSEECYQRMADKGFDEGYINASSSNKGFLKEWDVLPQAAAEKLVNESNPDSISPEILDKVETRLKSMSNYDTYRDEIDSFVDLVNITTKDRSNISLDLKKNWLEDNDFINKK